MSNMERQTLHPVTRNPQAAPYEKGSGRHPGLGLGRGIRMLALGLSLFLGGGLSGCKSQENQAGGTPSPSPSASVAGQELAAGGVGGSANPVGAPAGAVTASAGAPAGASNVAPKPGAEAGAPGPAMAPRPVATPTPPQVFTLASGSPISVWTARELSTKTAKDGDAFTGSLAEAIVDKDWVVAKKGARVDGVIVRSDPGGRVKGVASVTVALTKLTLADGRTISLSTSNFTKQAPASKKKDALKIGVGAGLGAAIGAIAGGGKGAAIGAGAGGAAGTGVVMATRGDPAVIPSESKITVRTTSTVKVTRQ